jgi:hypothetical protein
MFPKVHKQVRFCRTHVAQAVRGVPPDADIRGWPAKPGLYAGIFRARSVAGLPVWGGVD